MIKYDFDDDNYNHFGYRVDIFAYLQRGAVCLRSRNYESTEDLQEAISYAIRLIGLSHIVQLVYNNSEVGSDTRISESIGTSVVFTISD